MPHLPNRYVCLGPNIATHHILNTNTISSFESLYVKILVHSAALYPIF